MSHPVAFIAAMSIDAALRATAELQHALVSYQQARSLGASPKGLVRRAGSVNWEPVTSRVLRLVGAPRTSKQVLMAAVLDGGPGTVVSRLSAAALWRLPGFSFGPVQASRQRGRSSRKPGLGRLYLPLALPAHHATTVDAIPVTTLARTLFDLAALLRPERMERVVDTVVSRSPSTLRALHSTLEDLGEHGRNGIAVMRAILAERPPGYVPPASGLEARFMRILAEAGHPPLERQVDVGGHEWIGRVDFVDRESGLLVEVDSALHHSSNLDKKRDRQRDEALKAAGWRGVVRVPEEVIWHRPGQAVSMVHRARSRAFSYRDVAG